MKPITSKIPNKLSVWAEFNQICQKFQALNLSHGRPSVYPPEYLLEEMVKLSKIPDIHQYTSMWGHPELQTAIADYYSPIFKRQLKVNSEILITPGAMCGHYNGIFGIATQPSDEVFCFAPFFPTYQNQTQFAGVKFKTSKLEFDETKKEWKINFDDVIKKLNPNTRIFMLNSPHNPTGKIFTIEEQVQISKMIDEYAPNAVVINDVVYEDLLFDGNQFERFANILDNWRRTITVYSGGKLMSCTGWKIGWVIGPSELIKCCAIIHESTAYQTNTICQLAIARSLYKFKSTPSYGFPNYTAYLRNQFQTCRDMLIEGLCKSKLCLKPLYAEAGYFLLADVRGMMKHVDKVYYSKDEFENDLSGIDYKRFEDAPEPSMDYVASRYLALKHKVAPFPGSLFYTDEDFDHKYIRIALCQTVDTIKEAIRRIELADSKI